MLARLELTMIPDVTAIWNAACGPDLAIGTGAMRYNLAPARGELQEGRIAIAGGRIAGFVLAAALPGDPETSPPPLGWVAAIAVSPRDQRAGAGSELLRWAEAWLGALGCTHFELGGSLRPFAPGLPEGPAGSERFFRRRGYQNFAPSPLVWDVARSLRDYKPRPVDRPLPAGVETRAARPGDEEGLREFFRREYPGRWRFEFEEALRAGERISDFTVLRTERGFDGFARLTFVDSARPLDRFFMHRLPRPWGQLGPIGVSADCQGRGYGSALLDAGLHRLRAAGVDGCVIDWTDLVDFYARYGFRPFRRYDVLVKGTVAGEQTV